MECRKNFIIYCSGGASRILRFYGDKLNYNKFTPLKVVFDGESLLIAKELEAIFKGDLVHLKSNLLTDEEKNKIHATTSKFLLQIMRETRADFLLCFGDKILKKDIISEYPSGLINFHPSLLPAFRGLGAIDQALQYDASFLGNTAHYIDEGVDTGRVINQSTMPAEQFEDYEDVLELQLPMLKMVCRDILGYVVSEEELFSDIADRQKLYQLPLKCNGGEGLRRLR